MHVAKPEWGTKRDCTECGARFYDLTRTPIVCPKCEATVVIEVVKSRSKAKAEPAKPAAVPEVVAEEPKDDEAALLTAAGIEEDNSEDDEEDGTIGDVFVEDDDEDDDVTAVIDTPVATPTTE
jgi:uncharacterized protein (TIGR02300 family)